MCTSPGLCATSRAVKCRSPWAILLIRSMLIEQYGADGVRTGMLFSSPAGNDLLFDEKLCEQGRNFNNKIWNAFRLIKGWEVSETAGRRNQPNGNAVV